MFLVRPKWKSEYLVLAKNQDVSNNENPAYTGIIVVNEADRGKRLVAPRMRCSEGRMRCMARLVESVRIVTSIEFRTICFGAR